jgi:hypothetical protein
MTDVREPMSLDMRYLGTSVRWIGVAFLVVAVVLLSWMVVLALTLPTTESAQHWSVAWIGLDAMETAGLVVTGWLVLHRDIRVTMAASATGAFLLADAWFDMATAQPQWDFLQATLLALLVELPLSALCAALAISAPRWCYARGKRSAS